MTIRNKSFRSFVRCSNPDKSSFPAPSKYKSVRVVYFINESTHWFKLLNPIRSLFNKKSYLMLLPDEINSTSCTPNSCPSLSSPNLVLSNLSSSISKSLPVHWISVSMKFIPKFALTISNFTMVRGKWLTNCAAHPNIRLSHPYTKLKLIIRSFPQLKNDVRKLTHTVSPSFDTACNADSEDTNVAFRASLTMVHASSVVGVMMSIESPVLTLIEFRIWIRSMSIYVLASLTLIQSDCTTSANRKKRSRNRTNSYLYPALWRATHRVV